MSQPDDASLPTDREGLSAQLVLIEVEQAALAAELRRLMDAEDPAQGLFHAKEINQLRHNKIMLEFQRRLRVARLNRLDQIGMED